MIAATVTKQEDVVEGPSEEAADLGSGCEELLSSLYCFDLWDVPHCRSWNTHSCLVSTSAAAAEGDCGVHPRNILRVS